MFVLPFVAMQKRSESVSVAANAQQLPHLPSLKYGIIGMPHVSINSVPELCDRESEREREGGGHGWEVGAPPISAFLVLTYVDLLYLGQAPDECSQEKLSVCQNPFTR